MAETGVKLLITGDSKGLRRDLDRANRKLASTGKAGKSMGDSLKRGVAVGAKAIAALGAATSAMAVIAGKAFVEYEKKFAELTTLLPGAHKDMLGGLEDDLRSFALRVGADLNDTLGAAYDAVSAGITQSNLVGFLETTYKAGVAGATNTCLLYTSPSPRDS